MQFIFGIIKFSGWNRKLLGWLFQKRLAEKHESVKYSRVPDSTEFNQRFRLEDIDPRKNPEYLN